MHVGPIDIEDEDTFGTTVNFTARVIGKAKGPEIWISDDVKKHLNQVKLEQHAALQWKKHHRCKLKGFQGAFTLWSLFNSRKGVKSAVDFVK